MNNPSSADERVADYTYLLTWFTFFMMIANVGVWWASAATIRQGRETAERQLRAYVHIDDTRAERIPFRWNRNSLQLLLRGRIFGSEPTSPGNALRVWIYPYLLRGMEITRPNEVWAMDIAYIPMARGFVHLAIVLDWFSRRFRGSARQQIARTGGLAQA